MENCKSSGEHTLMQVFEKLENRCSNLRDVAGMTERLINKLNRTEGLSKELPLNKPTPVEQLNIVELFNTIAHAIDEYTNQIGNNTDRAIGMIE